jgi:hypothetical protein
MNQFKIPDSLAKISVNFTYWACVAITFPIVGLISKALGISSNLDSKIFFEITKYFDSKLFFGLAGGCIFLFVSTKFVNVALEKWRPNPERDMLNYVIDEIFSQCVGIGSIINVIVELRFLNIGGLALQFG